MEEHRLNQQQAQVEWTQELTLTGLKTRRRRQQHLILMLLQIRPTETTPTMNAHCRQCQTKKIEMSFLVRWCFQRTLVPSFFLSIFFFCLFCILPNYIWLISLNSSTTTMSSTTTAGVCRYVCVCGYARVCVGMRRGGRVCIGVHKCALVCVKVCGCLRVCVLDEFSEYLLENRVPTSADFNTYSIRIFCSMIWNLKKIDFKKWKYTHL